MKFIRIDLLTLLISLFILGSCKNPDGVGLAIDPATALQTNLIDSATINAVTVRDDSVETSQSNAALAFFKDPIFGTTEANIATSISLPSSSAFTLPTTTGPIIIDSAVLVLGYVKGFYGDLNTTYKLNVYQLSEPIVSSKAYYNTKSWLYGNTILGSLSFKPKPKDSIKITNVITGAADTLYKVGPQLRIPISTSFINQYFFGATSGQLSTNSIFQYAVKGLFISLNTTTLTAGAPGGNMFFDMTGGTSKIDVYYHYANTSSTIDTVVTTLPIGSPHAVQIKHGYVTTPNPLITTQINDANAKANYSTVYLQALSGLRAKISFPYIKNIIKNAGTDIVVNRAELVVTPDPATYSVFAPSPRLTLYRYDIAHQRVLIPDASSADIRYLSPAAFGGYFDAYHSSYHFLVTGLVEDLMRGKLTDYGMFMAPTDTTGTYTGSETISASSPPTLGGRTVIGGGVKTSPYRMKLNIIYNKVTK